MNRFALILVCASLLFASVSRASAPSAPEEGVFDVKLSAPGQADIVDRLYFTDGQFDSRACRGRGFAKAACTLSKGGSGATFVVTTTSPKATVLWSGTITGDAVSGTATWTQGKGKPTVYAVNGKRVASLYDRLGGAGAIAQVVDTFIDKLVDDEALNRNLKIKEARSRVPRSSP